mgnify:CR=1 FL=1
MKKEVKEALNVLKTFLGMEVKLEQMKLKDGVTILEFDVLEKDNQIFIVNEEERVLLPIGEYEFEDGKYIKIEQEGVISEVLETKPAEEVEEVEEEEEVEMEKEAPAKKVVESTVKETHFSKEEKEKLEKEIEELKAKITELSKVEEVEEKEVELSEDVKPITFNPENKEQIEVVKLGKGKTNISSILEKVYN